MPPSPIGRTSPYILGDTTRPRHITCVLVWSESDQRRLRKTLHKQTDKPTDRHYENNGHMAVNQWCSPWPHVAITRPSQPLCAGPSGPGRVGMRLGLLRYVYTVCYHGTRACVNTRTSTAQHLLMAGWHRSVCRPARPASQAHGHDNLVNLTVV